MFAANKTVLITVASAACAWSTFAQSLLFRDDFGGPNQWSWGTIVNQQLLFSTAIGSMNTNVPSDSFCGAAPPVLAPAPLSDNQTLEYRVDLVGRNQDELAAHLHYAASGTGGGYAFVKSQDIVAFFKFFDGGPSMAFFFSTNCPLKDTNVVLVLALTRRGSNLEINTRILDKDNANAVLFDRTVVDTPEADPVLPSGAVEGMVSTVDRAGTPWPIVHQGPVGIVLGMTWYNSTRGTEGAAQVTFDNMEVWQYETPPLAIQNAVVLSWPLTQGQFVLESATSVAGPWTVVPEPWWRTNASQNEVSIRAPDSMRLFRLRFMP